MLDTLFFSLLDGFACRESEFIGGSGEAGQGRFGLDLG
jgi:hypothetical protein